MTSQSGFYGLGIAPNILSVLDKNGFTIPTPIQEQCIPQAIEGKDLIGIAQTGTGKTFAFGIPMIQAALSGKQGLVVLPTRELALQVAEVYQKIGGALGIKSAVLIGGEAMGRQLQALRRNPDVVIGTPGRIIDHLEQKTLGLKNVTMLVLDEADRMLDMGFKPQLTKILAAVPKVRQTMLFSATMPPEILKMAQLEMQLPTRVEIAPQGTTAAKITQELFFVPRQDKPRLLEKILGEYRGSVLVFSRTKHGAKRIAQHLRAAGHTAAEIHSNKSLNQRKEALEGFRNGKYRILVATDIASRGIDVKGIELVLNFDLPDDSSDYVHRIGRTGRAGGAGHAISFATPDQRRDVYDIERLVKAALPVSKIPADLPPHRAQMPYEPDERPSFGRGRPGARGGRPFPPRSGGSSGYGTRNRNSSGPRRYGR